MLVEKTIPIGVGIALPLTWSEGILARMPAGVVKFFGRFGVAGMSALLGSVIAGGTYLVLPEAMKPAGYLAASAATAVAGLQVVKALIGTSSPVSTPVSSPSQHPAQTPVFSKY